MKSDLNYTLTKDSSYEAPWNEKAKDREVVISGRKSGRNSEQFD